MNFKCLICSDIFTPQAEIYTTPCGHLFHYHCLAQWLERSRTCPQCRRKTTEKSILKIYLSVEENAGEIDTGVLQNKLDNLQFQMNLKEKDIKIANEKYANAKRQTVGLKEEIKTQEHRARVLESATHALKEQITYFKSKSKDCIKLEEEIVRLKGVLRDMEHVQTVLTGSREQVNDMLRNIQDPHSLTILVATLRKQLVDSDKKLKTSRKEAQNELQNHKMELSQLNRNLQQAIEAHKYCESERQYLKKKIDDLASKSKTESGNPLNTSIRRIIAESPTPLPKLTQLKNESTNRDTSPSVQEKVQAIKDSDSPYLQAQSSVLGYTSHLGKHAWLLQQRPSSASTVTNNKFSIFKQRSGQLTDLKRPLPQGSYDGLGGHAKEDLFPSPKLGKVNLKRPKSSSTITSAKFRKLAPQKKLNEFFKDSQSDCGGDD